MLFFLPVSLPRCLLDHRGISSVETFILAQNIDAIDADTEEIDFLPADSFPRWLQLPGMGQVGVRSFI